jgi:predicted nucleic acid-binding protein
VIYALDANVLVHATFADLPEYAPVHAFLEREVRQAGRTVALAAQTLHEYLHVVTDPRRFERPLDMNDAVDRAKMWATAREVHLLHPTDATVRRTLDLIAAHRLGRKRILDTALAALLLEHEVRHLVTRNGRDFTAFGLDVIDPLEAVTPHDAPPQ